MIFEDTVCSSILQGTKVKKLEDNCTRVSCHFFLKRWQIFARGHSFGSIPMSIDCWNRYSNIGPISVANSLGTQEDACPEGVVNASMLSGDMIRY